ncbi:hypothetical protein J4450_00985 [Candidatus Micrarchaeota archaeon]|nr:hypothetical protein [Candidatus Micrarchaeota archaeon]
MGESKLGEILFLVGVLLALVVGLLAGSVAVVQENVAGIYAVLALLGLLVGFMNISPKEAVGFLVAAIALLGVSSALTPLLQVESLASVAPAITGFLAALAVFVAPAALVVALISVYQMASGQEEGMGNELNLPPAMKASGGKRR